MESERLAKEWSLICNQIRDKNNIDTSQINAFFSRLQPQAMSDGFLMLTADNDFIKTWVQRHYVEYIKQALEELYGIPYVVAIEVDTNQATTAQQSPQPQPIVQDAQANASGKPFNEVSFIGGKNILNAAPAAPQTTATATQQAQGMVPTSAALTFDNYVIGVSNKMAYSMAVAVAEAPGVEPSLNPLFIYGKSGLGKTHLLKAIKYYIDTNITYLNTVYVDANQLIDEYTDAAANHDYKSFKTKYESADVLLIDDVQSLQGKKQTLDIVFQIFNNFIAQGKQIVLSADRAPKNIDIDERYSSRFNSGGTFDIQPPEFEVKLGIIRMFIEEYNRMSPDYYVNIPDESQHYIAECSSSNIRELKSAVTKIIYHMEILGKETITLEEIKKLLENHFTGGAMKKLTIADIQKQVEIYYKVSHADLIGKKRSRNIVYARQIAIYLARQMLDLPYSTIGKSFGGKDHTTIMYSFTNIEEKMKENLEIREELESIRQMIRED